VIAFVCFRLFLEFGAMPTARAWFANNPSYSGQAIVCSERLFGNPSYGPNGTAGAGGIIIPYWMFPDYFKSKTFISAFALPWFSWRILERRYEWSRLQKVAAVLCLYMIAVGITVFLWTGLILVRSVPNPCGAL